MSNNPTPYGEGDKVMEDAWVEAFKQTSEFGRIVLSVVVGFWIVVAVVIGVALYALIKSVS